MYTKTTILAVALLFCQASVSFSQVTNQKLYRIHTSDISKIRDIESKGVTVYNVPSDSIMEILATPARVAQLNISEAQIEFIANSFKELYDSQPHTKSGPQYHTYQSMVDELQALASAHPDITHLDTIGYSVLGRMILCLKISDNPETDEDEPPVLMVGNHHGNEILSVEATMYQINYLLDNYGTDPEVTFWINGMEIWYIPMFNPDGHEALRRTNENGVDLNRNYSFGFTAESNHGPEAFSEPETQALRDWVERYPPIMSITYHTSGRYVLYSWTHTDDAAPDSTSLIYVGNKIAESIQFPPGGSTDHYTLRQGGRWYFTAGEYIDYMYRNYNTFAFTVEMWTSQSPDASVIPQVVERNINGMITLFRQVHKSGVTGNITAGNTSLPVVASIRVTSIDDQGKLLPVKSDSVYGRYYRYLSPGTYTLEVSAPGYRNQYPEVSIDEDSLTTLNIELAPGPMISVSDVELVDDLTGRTNGNGDGKINLGETIGMVVQLENTNTIDATGTYLQVTAPANFVELLNDQLQFGTVEGDATKVSSDTLYFRLDSTCPDGELLEFVYEISDSEGFGWTDNREFEAYTPSLEIDQIVVHDQSGNQNGVLDNGESATIEVNVINTGRQPVHHAVINFSSGDSYFHLNSEMDQAEIIEINSGYLFHFDVSVDLNSPPAHVARIQAEVNTNEAYTKSLSFNLHNIKGYFDDFENGINGWSHHSYNTTSNNHDDWQLGTPAGKGLGDPINAWSGENCWGTDLGWDDFQGTSWDGNYQNNVYNFLRSPVIDCSNLTGVGLKFMRILNTRNNDFGRVKVNGHLVWQSSIRGLSDLDWTEQTLDISEFADKASSVVITFELESNGSGNLGGWNIDDVIVGNGLFPSGSGVESNLVATQPLLYDCYPNPFETETTIRYYLPAASHTELIVYDAFGRQIAKLWSGFQPSGIHEIEWNGPKRDGKISNNGLYFYQLITTEGTQTKRMIMLR